jgi:hypothetical protein
MLFFVVCISCSPDRQAQQQSVDRDPNIEKWTEVFQPSVLPVRNG